MYSFYFLYFFFYSFHFFFVLNARWIFLTALTACVQSFSHMTHDDEVF